MDCGVFQQKLTWVYWARLRDKNLVKEYFSQGETFVRYIISDAS